MSDVTMEQKLQLLQQIRSRYNENQSDMVNRERILCGKYPYGSSQTFEAGADEERSGRISFFKIRLLLAFTVFLTVVMMDINDIRVAGITVEQIYQVISADYEDKIDEWIESFAASYSNPQRYE